eukprot:jgi/Bigna1/127590/aug1.4_g2298
MAEQLKISALAALDVTAVNDEENKIEKSEEQRKGGPEKESKRPPNIVADLKQMDLNVNKTKTNKNTPKSSNRNTDERRTEETPQLQLASLPIVPHPLHYKEKLEMDMNLCIIHKKGGDLNGIEDMRRYANYATQIRRQIIAQCLVFAQSSINCFLDEKKTFREKIETFDNEDRKFAEKRMDCIQPTVGVIGCGRVGKKLVNSLLKYKVVSPKNLLVSTRRPEELYELKKLGVRCFFDNPRLIAESRIVFLCVLPDQMQMVSTSCSKLLAAASRLQMDLMPGEPFGARSPTLGSTSPTKNPAQIAQELREKALLPPKKKLEQEEDYVGDTMSPDMTHYILTHRIGARFLVMENRFMNPSTRKARTVSTGRSRKWSGSTSDIHPGRIDANPGQRLAPLIEGDGFPSRKGSDSSQLSSAYSADKLLVWQKLAEHHMGKAFSKFHEVLNKNTS